MRGVAAFVIATSLASSALAQSSDIEAIRRALNSDITGDFEPQTPTPNSVLPSPVSPDATNKSPGRWAPLPPGRKRPRFEDYRVPTYFAGQNVQPILDTPDKWNYRTRIRNAAKSLRANFAGRYIVETWGCGTSCLLGTVIDGPSGQVYMWPFNVVGDYRLDEGPNDDRVQVRRDSSLIIFKGRINEEDPLGRHYYVFTGAEFKHLLTEVYLPAQE